MTNTPKPQANTVDWEQYICRGVHCKCMGVNCSNYHNGDHACHSSGHELNTQVRKQHNTLDEIDTFQQIQALVTEAQQNAVAWSMMVLDDLHTDCVDKYAMSAEFDKFYKGAKNTIRDRYKNETGVDPTPGYPILVQLKGNK